MDRRKRTARTVALMSLFSMTDTHENVPVASFDGDGSDLISLIVGIEPVQAGSGDPSPDNVRPISGWTECKVTRTGRNLLDTKNYAPSATTSSGITIVQNQDGSFKVSGTATGVVNLWLRGAWGGTNPVLKLYAGKTYFIKDCMLYNGASMIGSAVNMGQTGTYTPSADIEVTGVRASTPKGTTLDTTIYPYVTDSADTEWQEFGTTYPIPLGQTVYGGTLDVVTGVLTVDRANIASYNGEPLPSTWISDRDVYAVGTMPTTGAQVVYKLATPIVYDLTPTEINTLIGTNNIWADTGEIKYIEYNV